MALETRDLPSVSALRRQVVRVVLASSGAVLVFIVALSWAAWSRRDEPVGVPHVAVAGSTAAAADAGVPTAYVAAPTDAGGGPDVAPRTPEDAGVVVTVAGDVDAGPAHVAPAPVDAAAVGAELEALAQACLVDALRFDPSLGGTLVVTAAFGADAPATLTVTGVSSPLFRRCLDARLASLAWPHAGTRLELRARVSLDGLRGVAKLAGAELVEVAAPAP